MNVLMQSAVLLATTLVWSIGRAEWTDQEACFLCHVCVDQLYNTYVNSTEVTFNNKTVKTVLLFEHFAQWASIAFTPLPTSHHLRLFLPKGRGDY